MRNTRTVKILTGVSFPSVSVCSVSASADVPPEGFAGGRATYELGGVAGFGELASAFVRLLQ